MTHPTHIHKRHHLVTFTDHHTKHKRHKTTIAKVPSNSDYTLVINRVNLAGLIFARKTVKSGDVSIPAFVSMER